MGYRTIYGYSDGTTSHSSTVGTAPASVLHTNIEPNLLGYINLPGTTATRYKKRGYVNASQQQRQEFFDPPAKRMKIGGNFFGYKMMYFHPYLNVLGFVITLGWDPNTGGMFLNGAPNGIGARSYGHWFPVTSWCNIIFDIGPYDIVAYVDGDLAFSATDPYQQFYTWWNPSEADRVFKGITITASAIDDFWMITDNDNSYPTPAGVPKAGSIVKTLRPSVNVSEEWVVTGTGTTAEVLAGASIDDVNYVSTQYANKYAMTEVADPFDNPPLTSVSVVKQSVWGGYVSDGGASSIKQVVSNGTTTIETSGYLPTDATYQRDFVMHETNPIDSSAWSDGDADSLIWGIKSE